MGRRQGGQPAVGRPCEGVGGRGRSVGSAQGRVPGPPGAWAGLNDRAARPAVAAARPGCVLCPAGELACQERRRVGITGLPSTRRPGDRLGQRRPDCPILHNTFFCPGCANHDLSWGHISAYLSACRYRDCRIICRTWPAGHCRCREYWPFRGHRRVSVQPRAPWSGSRDQPDGISMR